MQNHLQVNFWTTRINTSWLRQMMAIWQTFFNAFSWKKFLHLSLTKFSHKGPVDNIGSGNNFRIKPLLKSMMIELSDACIYVPQGLNVLKHWGQYKMAAILQALIWNAFCSVEIIAILFKICLIFFPKGPINNRPALFQIMDLCWIGDRPLAAQLMALLKFTDACMHYSALMSWTIVVVRPGKSS